MQLPDRSDPSKAGGIVSPDFEHDYVTDSWYHRESGVLIFGEDMPRELKPWAPRDEETP